MSNYTLTVKVADPALTSYAAQPGSWTISISGAAAGSVTSDTPVARFANCPAGNYTVSIVRTDTAGNTLQTCTYTHTITDGDTHAHFLGFGTVSAKAST